MADPALREIVADESLASPALRHILENLNRALPELSSWHDAATGLIDALVGLWLAPVTHQRAIAHPVDEV
jgi:hypothetical protein